MGRALWMPVVALLASVVPALPLGWLTRGSAPRQELRSRRASRLAASASQASQSGVAALVDVLSGVFDNGQQSRADAGEGRANTRGDGHEHIRVEIATAALPGLGDRESTLVASYAYVGEDGSLDVFRYRWYALEDEGGGRVRMRIHRIGDAWEARLRSADTWMDVETLRRIATETGAVEYLPSTDVIWTPQGDGAFQGLLASDSCLVPSQRDPKRLLRVTDDLRVTETFLYINDRVEDAETGALFYGNAEGIPYTLERQR